MAPRDSADGGGWPFFEVAIRRQGESLTQQWLSTAPAAAGGVRRRRDGLTVRPKSRRGFVPDHGWPAATTR